MKNCYQIRSNEIDQHHAISHLTGIWALLGLLEELGTRFQVELLNPNRRHERYHQLNS